MEYSVEIVSGVVILVVVGIFALALYITNRDDEETGAEVKKDIKDLEEVNVPHISWTGAPPTSGTITTANSNETKFITLNVNVPYGAPDRNGNMITKEALEGAIKGFKKTAPSKVVSLVTAELFPARVLKLKTGKKLMWGCSICPDKVYKHAPSVYNHIKTAHK